MLGLNGGLIGAQRSSKSDAASGVWTLNEQVIYQRKGIWLGDPNYDNVSLLLHMDGSNGSTTFVDNSKYTLTPTVNGNAQISTTQSKFGGSSASFDGAGDNLLYTSNALSISANQDFTWEGWFYANSLGTSTQYRALLNNDAGLGSPPRLYLKGSTLMVYILSADRFAHQNAVSINTWHHFAMVRESNIVYSYLDGVKSTSSFSYSTGPVNSNLRVGGDSFGGQDFNGYIDELRITIGFSRYTSNFTPPTAPFPSA